MSKLWKQHHRIYNQTVQGANRLLHVSATWFNTCRASLYSIRFVVSLKHPKQLTRQTLQIYITECCVSIPQQTSFIISPPKKKHTKQTTSHRKLATETSLTTSSSTCRWSWHFVSRLRCTNSHTTTTPWADYPLALSTESRNHCFIKFNRFQGISG